MNVIRCQELILGNRIDNEAGYRELRLISLINCILRAVARILGNPTGRRSVLVVNCGGKDAEYEIDSTCGLPALNFWDSVLQFVQPLAEIVRGIAEQSIYKGIVTHTFV